MKGFSLIELMVVLAILAVTAAIAIPLYDSYKQRAIRSEAEQELMNLAAIEEDYFNSYRRYLGGTDISVIETLEDFYGVNRYGEHFQIRMYGDSTAYEARAYVCYELAGADCDPGDEDLICTITPSMEKPSCI